MSISSPGCDNQARKNTVKNWREGKKETLQSSVEHLECTSWLWLHNNREAGRLWKFVVKWHGGLRTLMSS